MTKPSEQIHFRQRNRTFYTDLERLHQVLVSPGLRVLEVGCGTGDLLAHLKPSHGVGIELDPEVAAVARERHPQLRILATNAETMTPQSIGETQPFDVILLPNTLNTLQDVQGVLERLEAFCHPRTRLVVSFHNWLWQPMLKAAEHLGQRQPQPPESWLTPNDVRNLLDLASWEMLKEGNRCLIPRQIPLLTPIANRWLSQLPLINNLGLTHWMVARPARQQRQDPSVSVVIPARNEAGNIAPAIERLPSLGCFTEVIFVEGHSSDNTWDEIERVCKNYQGPMRLKKFRQTGKGKADAV